MIPIRQVWILGNGQPHNKPDKSEETRKAMGEISQYKTII